MDTERDENQSLKNDIDDRQNNSINSNNSGKKWYDNDLAEKQSQEDTDYADDQNNSNTGYNENLLEKELDLNNDNPSVEEDLIVKNGIIIDDEDLEGEEETADSGENNIDNNKDL